MVESTQDISKGLDTGKSSVNGRFALLVLCGLVFCWASHYMVNGDIWWHLRTGQIIPEKGIPTTDWYTFASSDSKWIDLHWLFQLIVAGVFSLWQTEGLVLFKAILSTTTVFFLLLPFMRDMPSSVMIILSWPFVSLFASRLLVRPEMLSFLLLVLTLLVIHKSMQCITWIFALPVIQVVWVNCQGLFVLQYVVMVSFALQVCWSQSVSKTPVYLDKKWRSKFFFVGVFTGIATLLNPYGVEGAVFPLELMEKMGGDHKEFYLEYAGEIRGLGELFASNSVDKVLSIPAVLHLLFVAVLTLAALFLNSGKNSKTIYHTCLFISFGYLGWSMSRNDPLVGLVFAYITLARVSADKRILTAFKSRNQSLRRYVVACASMLVVFLGYGIISGSYHHDLESPFEKKPWYGESVIYPHEAAKFVNRLTSIDEVYADHELLASLCIYHMRSDQRVFADARLEVNTKGSLADMREIRRLLNSDINAAMRTLENYGSGTKALVFMNHTFFSPQLPSLLSNLAQSPDWICVFSDKYSEDAGPSGFILGASVFVPREVASGAALTSVSVEHLLSKLRN